MDYLFLQVSIPILIAVYLLVVLAVCYYTHNLKAKWNK